MSFVFCPVLSSAEALTLSLTTHSRMPALVYLSGVLVHSLLLSLQASDPRVVTPGGVSPTLREGEDTRRIKKNRKIFELSIG